MPIININNYPKLDFSLPQEYRISFRDGNYLFNLRKWDDHNYWYCEIKDDKSFNKSTFETLIPTPLLNKIRSDDNTFLVVSNTHEAFHNIVEPLYRVLVIQLNIPPKKVVLMSESADIFIEVVNVSKKYQVDTFQVFWTLIFESQIKNEIKVKPRQILRNINEPHKKCFLNLNRRWRLHRPALVAFLTSLDLLNKGYVSLGLSDDERRWKDVYSWLVNHYRSDPELCDLLISNKEKILNLPDLYLDTTDLVTNRSELSAELDYFYQNSFFSLVTETNFYYSVKNESGRFFSEKIFKPMAHRHPFILVSVPRSLDLLKELGYQTFSDWIDESYDDEFDDNLRMKKILNEVNRLCQLTQQEIADFVKGTKSIVEHNYRKLSTRQEHCYKKL